MGENARERLYSIAKRALTERGFRADFGPSVLEEVESLTPLAPDDPSIRDLRGMLWCSIDNQDSRDLDQLTVAEPLGGGAARILVAIADVDAHVTHRPDDPPAAFDGSHFAQRR
jgi:exoribonuclease-2